MRFFGFRNPRKTKIHFYSFFVSPPTGLLGTTAFPTPGFTGGHPCFVPSELVCAVFPIQSAQNKKKPLYSGFRKPFPKKVMSRKDLPAEGRSKDLPAEGRRKGLIPQESAFLFL